MTDQIYVSINLELTDWCSLLGMLDESVVLFEDEMFNGSDHDYRAAAEHWRNEAIRFSELIDLRLTEEMNLGDVAHVG